MNSVPLSELIERIRKGSSLRIYCSAAHDSILKRWKKKYGCKIDIVEVTDFTVLQNEFYDEKGGKLD